MKELDQALQLIALKRNELQQLDYGDPQYDDSEEELHDMEDSFLDKFGDQMEDVIQDVHDEHCPETDVLLPIAYMAKKYIVTDKNEFSVEPSEGIFVELAPDDKPARLVLVPNPVRLQLNLGNNEQKIVWQSEG